jgi:hypothetical protein
MTNKDDAFEYLAWALLAISIATIAAYGMSR